MTSQILESQITCPHDTQILKPIVIQQGEIISPTLLACKDCHDFFNSLQSFKIISEEKFLD